MLLLGHRGSLRHARENTMRSFELALEHGCDGFELDVRLSGDRHAVVFHDSAVMGTILAESSHEQIRKAAELDVPSLREVWMRFAARCFLNIELKVEGLEEHVVALFNAEPPRRGLLVSSFVPEVVESLYRAAPAIPLGYVCKDPAKLECWRDLPITTAVLHHNLLCAPLVEELHRTGKKIISWTVNSDSEMRRLGELGIDGIISDDTLHLCQVFGRSREAARLAGRSQ